MSFFASNLAALASKPAHEPLIELLQQTPFAWDEAITAYQTEAGDYTLVWNNQAVHSLSGAVEEAEALLENDWNTNQYGQNIVLGLGLGYLLQAALKKLKATKQTGRVVVYEPKLPLLRFVLEHVNLSSELSHPQTLLVHQEEIFIKQVMSQFLQGDGLSVLFTPGYGQLLNKQDKAVIDRLRRHVDNNQLNTFLLQGRSKEWAVEFLQNVPSFPKARPVDCLSGVFTGKPVVIVSAGPSLEEQMDALKAIQDSVVIMAIGGAMRALHAAGVIPHFVTFMDSVGPSRHLHGLEDSLKDSQIIVGPSAERMVMQLPRTGLWLAGQHYNEQFTSLLDAAYERLLYRYHTGGTVSMFTFHMAIELGFQQFVFVGQDLALRGNQFYAGGFTGTINKDPHTNIATIEVPQTETMTARSVPLQEVKGQNGEMLLTQEDYAHFIHHFETTARLLHEEVAQGKRPGLRLINASVGGAYLEGFEHLPLAAAANSLPLEAFRFEALLQPAIERANEWQEAELSASFLRTMQALQADVKQCQKLAQKALGFLQSKLLGARPEVWVQRSKAYSEAFNAFSETLEGNPFLHDTYYHEQLALRHHYVEHADTLETIKANFLLDEKYLLHLLQHFKQHLLPAVEETCQRLEAGVSV